MLDSNFKTESMRSVKHWFSALNISYFSLDDNWVVIHEQARRYFVHKSADIQHLGLTSL